MMVNGKVREREPEIRSQKPEKNERQGETAFSGLPATDS